MKQPIVVRIEHPRIDLVGQALQEYGQAIIRKLDEAGVPVLTEWRGNHVGQPHEVVFLGIAHGELVCQTIGGERIFTWYPEGEKAWQQQSGKN